MSSVEKLQLSPILLLTHDAARTNIKIKVKVVYRVIKSSEHNTKQDRQASLKAKYCPRVATVASAGCNKVASYAYESNYEQGHQALLKAQYYPRAAAVSYTQKRTKIHVTLTYDLDMQ